MVYPETFEHKIEFTRIRVLVKSYCISTLGEEWVDQMQYQNNYEAIRKELLLTNEFKHICQFEDEFPLGHFIDVREPLKKIRVEGSYLEVQEVFDLKRSLEAVKSIIQFFQSKEEDKYPALKDLVKEVKVFPFVLDMVNTIINKQGNMKDKASNELFTIRSEIKIKENKISKTLHHILKKAQSEGLVESDVQLSIREGRAVIPVNAANKRKIRGLVLDESATGKTVYIEPSEIVELNNELRELEYQERREIINILVNFSNQIRPYAADLQNNYAFLGTVDFIRAKALFAIRTRSLMPALKKEAGIYWKDAVHPLLLMALEKEGRKIVPLDMELNQQQRILLISGPNAGGKSVCLKTVGLLQYMLQCGMLVPLSEDSEVGMYNDIFIDIGDEQSIDNDLSTYSSHLMNMKFFVKNATKNSLVLMDEFGSGTEPMLGGAIAESILEEFNRLEVFGVITTHYSNLKHFASSAPGIQNAAMLYDTGKMEPLFKLSVGKPGSSFAFEIARTIGLPETVLKSAAEKVGEGHISFDKHLKEIIRDKRYWETKRQNIRKVEKNLEISLEKYQKELEEIKSLRKEILEKAREEARGLLQNVNKKIENTIRVIRETQAQKEETQKARKELEGFREGIVDQPAPEEEQILIKIEQIKRRESRIKKFSDEEQKTPEADSIPVNDTLQIGDKVTIKEQDVVGEVLDTKGKSILIAFGNMMTTIKKDKLEKISENEFKKHAKQQNGSYSSWNINEKKLTFKPEIDLRGKRTEEALKEVTDFIDRALMVSVSHLRILHGKGNGILRQQIRDYLKTIEVVKEFHDEHVEFGGTGITVVKLDD